MSARLGSFTFCAPRSLLTPRALYSRGLFLSRARQSGAPLVRVVCTLLSAGGVLGLGLGLGSGLGFGFGLGLGCCSRWAAVACLLAQYLAHVCPPRLTYVLRSALSSYVPRSLLSRLVLIAGAPVWRAACSRRMHSLFLLISERRVCVCARLASISLQSTVTPRCIMHVDVGVKIASLRFVCVYVSRAIYRRYVPTRDKEVSLADHVPVDATWKYSPGQLPAASQLRGRKSTGYRLVVTGTREVPKQPAVERAERVGRTTHAYGERTCT